MYLYIVQVYSTRVCSIVPGTYTAAGNNEIPDQATSGQPEAAALSVRCIHFVFPLTRSTKHCHVATIKVNSSAK